MTEPDIDINPKYWGAGGWAIIFCTIYKYGKLENADLLNSYLDNLYLPCSTCRKNLAEEKSKINYESIESVHKIRSFYVKIYNMHHKKNKRIHTKKLSLLKFPTSEENEI